MKPPLFKVGDVVWVVAADLNELATVIEVDGPPTLMRNTVLVQFAGPGNNRRWFLPEELRLDVIATLGNIE